MIRTWPDLMTKYNQRWDPDGCSSECPTNEMVALIVLGCFVELITKSVQRKDRCLLRLANVSTCVC